MREARYNIGEGGREKNDEGVKEDFRPTSFLVEVE